MFFFYMQQVQLYEELLGELTYFAEGSLDGIINEEMLKKPSLALLMKRSSENLPNAIDEVVAQMVYGNLRKPPGDDNCPYQKLILRKDGTETVGIWTPPNSLCKAMALKWFFPNISGTFKLPEETPVPPHVIVGYDAFKYKEVMELGEQFPGSILKFGFFSSDIPGAAELITKTADKFEKRTAPPTYEEKLVIQLAKRDDSFMAFTELGPSYISPNTVQGEEEAKMFFPPTYDIPEEIILEIKKKPKRKGKGKFVAVVQAHEEIFQMDRETGTENDPEQHTALADTDDPITEEKTNEEGEEDEEEEGEDGIGEIDKATSPMEDIGQTEETNN